MIAVAAGLFLTFAVGGVALLLLGDNNNVGGGSSGLPRIRNVNVHGASFRNWRLENGQLLGTMEWTADQSGSTVFTIRKKGQAEDVALILPPNFPFIKNTPAEIKVGSSGQIAPDMEVTIEVAP